MTRKVKGLLKRGGIDYYRRVIIPRSLAQVIGKTEYVASLHTGDLALAMDRTAVEKKKADALNRVTYDGVVLPTPHSGRERCSRRALIAIWRPRARRRFQCPPPSSPLIKAHSTCSSQRHHRATHFHAQRACDVTEGLKNLTRTHHLDDELPHAMAWDRGAVVQPCRCCVQAERESEPNFRGLIVLHVNHDALHERIGRAREDRCWACSTRAWGLRVAGSVTLPPAAVVTAL